MALRALTGPEVDSAISEEDLRNAASRLLEQEAEKTTSSMNPIGFGA